MGGKVWLLGSQNCQKVSFLNDPLPNLLIKAKYLRDQGLVKINQACRTMKYFILFVVLLFANNIETKPQNSGDYEFAYDMLYLNEGR